MSQRGSRSWKRCTFNHFHIQYLALLVHQLLGDVEQILKLFEVRVLVNFPNLSIIWSHMNRCLHWCRHKHFPDSYDGCVLGCPEVVPLLQDSPFSSCSWRLSPSTLNRRSAYCGIPASAFRRASPLRRRFPAAGWAEDSSIRTCVLVFEVLSIVLLPLLRIHRRPASVAHADCFQLRAGTPLWSKLWFPGLFGSLTSCVRIFLMLEKFKFTAFGFAAADPSFSLLSWTLFDMAHCFLIDQKEICWDGCSKTLDNSWCLTNEENGSTHHVWNFLWSTCLRVGVWCQCTGFKSWSPHWYCQMTKPRATLCVLETCLIVGLLSLMIILITASLSSRMYNWDSLWEECAFVVTWSTCDTWSTSRFPFCFGLEVRSLSGSRTQFPATGLFLVIWYCSMIVALLSPHPISPKQVVRPFSIQHPTK